MTLDLSQVHAATGYDPNEYFFASRYRQGDRTVYALDWSVRELVTFLPKPDATKPLGVDATQRRLYPTHARSFGEYVRSDRGWVSPALLLRAPSIFEFQPIEQIESGTTQFGLLAVPKDSKSEIQIVDGQHRTLGFHLAWEGLAGDIEQARITVARAKEAMDEIGLAQAQKRLGALLDRRANLVEERVSIQVVIVETPESARRIFVDINDNAKGITGAVKSRFDDRKVLTRVLNIVLKENELLQDRVDLEQDRIIGTSRSLLGAKHVLDILRGLTVGTGRIGKRLEDELNEKDVVKEFDKFVDALLNSFPDLTSVVDGQLTTSELRAKSLIGSNVMLRSLAIAWFKLREKGWTEGQIQDAFAVLGTHMETPVYPDSNDTWFATGIFPANEVGAFSPTSRAQDLKRLAQFITDACENDPSWVRVTK